jgi:hypothetical protein
LLDHPIALAKLGDDRASERRRQGLGQGVDRISKVSSVCHRFLSERAELSATRSARTRRQH